MAMSGLLSLVASLHAQQKPVNREDGSVTNQVQVILDEEKRLQSKLADSNESLRKLKNQLEAELSAVNAALKQDGYWDWGIQPLKPSARVYFDSGKDDVGEVDLFDDGTLGVSVDLASLYFDYWFKTNGLFISPFLSGGISSASGGASSDAVCLIWSAGIAIGHARTPVVLEVGYMQGVSAGETLNNRTRDDSAFFVGLSLNKLIEKVSFRK